MARNRRRTRRNVGSGSLTIKGDKWTGRYREQVIAPDGSVSWVKRSCIIGSVEKIDRDTANQILAGKIAAVRNRPPEASWTVDQYSRKIWLPRTAKSVKNSTEGHYRYILETHVVPAIGTLRMFEVTDTVLQNLYDTKLDEPVKIKGSNASLSWKTVKHIRFVTSAIFGLAVKQRLLSYNPVSPTRLPRRPYREPVIQDVEQMLRELRLLLHELLQPSRSVAWLLVTTGLRIGEALALQWRNVDFEKDLIHVSERLYDGVRDTVKTKNSVRDIPLLPVTKELLTARRPEDPDPFDLVFSTSNGTAFERRNLARQLQSTCDRLEIPRVNWHWFRHVTASYLDSLGVPTSVVTILLGHYSESVTSRIYTHAAMDKVRAAVGDIEKALQADGPQLDPKTDEQERK